MVAGSLTRRLGVCEGTGASSSFLKTVKSDIKSDPGSTRPALFQLYKDKRLAIRNRYTRNGALSKSLPPYVVLDSAAPTVGLWGPMAVMRAVSPLRKVDHCRRRKSGRGTLGVGHRVLETLSRMAVKWNGEG